MKWCVLEMNVLARGKTELAKNICTKSVRYGDVFVCRSLLRLVVWGARSRKEGRSGEEKEPSLGWKALDLGSPACRELKKKNLNCERKRKTERRMGTNQGELGARTMEKLF